MNQALRAGIIGASGIGKHHAKWLNALGCEVVAFAGTSPERVAAAAEGLRGIFDFRGRGYVGVEAMLQAEAPDLVAICSPPALHPQHLELAVERGCHVMCEKPLVWDFGLPMMQMEDQAAHMVQMARKAGIVAAVNTQYVAAVPGYLRLCREAGAAVDAERFSSFFMQMDSRGGKEGASGEKIWVELAPHPLSLLMAFAGPGDVVMGSETCATGPSEVNARFKYRTASGREIEAGIRVCNVPEGPLVRRFGVDGLLVDYEGRNDEAGAYAAYLRLGELEVKETDFVQTSITRFVAAVRGEGTVLADLEDGLRNLRLQLRLLQAGRRA